MDAKSEGLTEGILEGEKATKIEIARKMLALQRPINEILEDTGLIEYEINAIKQ